MSRLRRLIGITPEQLRAMGWERRQIPFYRDLALATVTAIALVGAIGNLVRWPISLDFDFKAGLVMLAIAFLAGFVSPKRLMVWAVAFTFLAFRGLVVLIFEESVSMLILTVIAAAAAYILLRVGIRREGTK